jgi:hypothetical protein
MKRKRTILSCPHSLWCGSSFRIIRVWSEDESIALNIALNVSNDDNEVIENREEEGDNAAAGSSQKKRKKNNDDPIGRMPGQLNSEAPPLDYHGKKEAAIAHIKTLIGKCFTVKHKNKSMIWTIVEEWILSDPSVENKHLLGLSKFDVTEYTKEQVFASHPLSYVC